MGEGIFQVLNYLVFTVFMVLCVYPFYYIFIYTLSDPSEVIKKGVYLLPTGFSLLNYQAIFNQKGIISAALVSTARTIAGTFITVFMSAMFGYVLTSPKLAFRKFIYRFTIVSMYLGAGLIPWYLTMRAYGLQNNFLLYVLPGAISAFFVMLIKTYIEQLPASLEESAIIDGAGYFTIFIRIILPLCMPILAAVAVFCAVSQWNSWFDNFLLVREPKLQTLQLLLWNFLNQSEALAASVRTDYSAISKIQAVKITPTSIRMTITMVVTMPIILVYPLLQKYFVKGIMLGAVKG